MSVDGVKQVLAQGKAGEHLRAEIKAALVKGPDKQEVDLDAAKDVQFTIRCSQAEKARWRKIADASGMDSLSHLIRHLMDTEYRKRFECQHPPECRGRYPWNIDTCLKCGERFQ